jgi:hypothetical protein
MAEITPVTSSPARRVGTTLAVGGVLGFIGWSLAGPAVIGWWYEPPVKEIYSCASSVESAVRQFVIAQLVCAALGGIAVSLLVFFVRRAWGGKASPAP